MLWYKKSCAGHIYQFLLQIGNFNQKYEMIFKCGQHMTFLYKSMFYAMTNILIQGLINKSRNHLNFKLKNHILAILYFL